MSDVEIGQDVDSLEALDWDLEQICEYSKIVGPKAVPCSSTATLAVLCEPPPCGCTIPVRFFCDPCYEYRNELGLIMCPRCAAPWSRTPSRTILRVERIR